MDDQIRHWESRIERFKETPPKSCDLQSYNGMRIQAEQRLDEWRKYRIAGGIDDHDNIRKRIIDFLTLRGYEINHSIPTNPELSKFMGFKQVRVVINQGGIMILLDPGAGMQLIEGHEFINPNANRIDWNARWVDGCDMINGIFGSINNFEAIASSETQYQAHIMRCKEKIGI